MSEALDKIEQFSRATLQKLLDQCTPAQQELFFKMYGTLDALEIPSDKVNWAIQQCEMAVHKNNAGRMP